MDLTWRYAQFDALSGHDVYAILDLRLRVFCLEQASPYHDTDGLDQSAMHLLGIDGDRLVAYLRVLPRGARFADHTIGRVVVDPTNRKRGVGLALVHEGLRQLFAASGGPVATALAAQAHLERFYGSLGYVRTAREPFLEDGILHVDMRRDAVALSMR
ncbi:MAG: GNAT family N-acetyltransferase [Polyangiales bacterium]|nr:GNAT family N-acetyltransferase [Myxococcales bacterium]